MAKAEVFMNKLPKQVQSWLGKPVVQVNAMISAEPGLWQNFCAAVEDGNPLYWCNEDCAGGIGPIAPPAMLASWVIEHEWFPNMRDKKQRTLELHFMLKDAFALPFGVVTGVEIEFGRPVRSGDRLRAEQILKEVGPEYQTRMGLGRKWTIDVAYYHSNDDLAGIQTLHFVSYRED
jgi:hypothetical protein